MQVRKQQLELDLEQQTGSKSGKEYVKAVYCHPAYLISISDTHPSLECQPPSCNCLLGYPKDLKPQKAKTKRMVFPLEVRGAM